MRLTVQCQFAGSSKSCETAYARNGMCHVCHSGRNVSGRRALRTELIRPLHALSLDVDQHTHSFCSIYPIQLPVVPELFGDGVMPLILECAAAQRLHRFK